ncbi:MAG TPA: hypothetical protein VIR16_00475 [Candidatus Limnocylindrales bacterium]
MSPALLLAFLVASLLSTLPVRRLYQAGWTSGALFTAWLVYLVGILSGLEVGIGSRYLLPVLVVLFVLPYVAGQSRLEKVGRLFGASRRATARPVINVTPPSGKTIVDTKAEPSKKRRGRKPPVEIR